MLDLLTEPVLHVNGGERLNLPEVFARLARGEDLAFIRLRPHQQPAWHAFLVQLGYHGLDVAGLSHAPQEATPWRELLAALTPDPSAWQLVEGNFARPAFLQAPAIDSTAFTKTADSLQALDLLTTSKNFDEKAEKMGSLRADQADALVFALVSLQGWAPFQGAGNYSSMRMNGGFSARTQFRLLQQRGSGAEWYRDLQALLAQRERFLLPREPGDMGSRRALRLLWLEPWGDAPLALADVHPLALEVCRRIRVLPSELGELRVLRASSKSMRVDAKAQLGAVRDPWVPLVLSDGPPKALTAKHDSLGYKKLSTLLFDRSQCQLPLLALPAPSDVRDADATLVAQVLVGESGGSDGLLRREVPLPRQGLALLQRGDARLGLRARQQVERAGAAWGKVLRSALFQYLDGGEAVNWKNTDFARIVDGWSVRWDAAVDAVFFERLFADLQHTNDEADARWLTHLAELALALFEAALGSLPTRSASPRLAAARAERLLHGGWRKQFNTALCAPPETADVPHA